jgi:hypothetical protein
MKITDKELADYLGLKSKGTIPHMKKHDLIRYELLIDGMKYRKMRILLGSDKESEVLVEQLIETVAAMIHKENEGKI